MTVSTDPKSEAISLDRFEPLYLLSNTAKGRGVFAGQRILLGTTIDTCPVLVLDFKENAQNIEKTSLYHYTYNWPITDSNGKSSMTQAIVFGLGSMFNHSTQNQNVVWRRNLNQELIIYRALRDIEAGEELCISYGDHLTFVDADQPDANGTVETEDEHLGRIHIEDMT